VLEELIRRSRSYRRFDQQVPTEMSTLSELVELARLSPSAANRQPLKFALYTDSDMCARIFPNLAWAGYLRDWDGPAEGERPTGYVVILGDTTISEGIDCDHGIAAQTILLGAVERGLGGCIIGSIDREGLRSILGLPDEYRILLILALGVPAEQVVLEEATDSIEYYRDTLGVHHVPKRPLTELIVSESGE
jgi:nitroreductase